MSELLTWSTTRISGLILAGLLILLPAAAARLAPPAPYGGGEGCILVFTGPNDFHCVGPCSNGEDCSPQAMVIQRIDGSMILRCGTDCVGVICRTEFILSPDGLLTKHCRWDGCSTECALEPSTGLCECEGSEDEE